MLLTEPIDYDKLEYLTCCTYLDMRNVIDQNKVLTIIELIINAYQNDERASDIDMTLGDLQDDVLTDSIRKILGTKVSNDEIVMYKREVPSYIQHKNSTRNEKTYEDIWAFIEEKVKYDKMDEKVLDFLSYESTMFDISLEFSDSSKEFYPKYKEAVKFMREYYCEIERESAKKRLQNSYRNDESGQWSYQDVFPDFDPENESIDEYLACNGLD